MEDAGRNQTRNLLLDALSTEERERLLDGLESHPIAVGRDWRMLGEAIETVMFPVSGTMSVIAETGDARVEAATIGREGVVDVFAAIGSRIAPATVIGQVPGEAFEVPIERFLKVYEEGPTIKLLVHGYMEALFVQVSLNAACLAVHHLNERCAKWLLQTHDRVDDDTFELKQEFLAVMLGVQRPSVSIAAKTLQSAGLISYRRGKITVMDRDGLEDAACPCYEDVRSAYSRLVPLR